MNKHTHGPDCEVERICAVTLEEALQAQLSLRALNAGLLAALEQIAGLPRKSLLEACAYQGPPGAKWLKETAPIYDAYNEALKVAQGIARAAIAKTEETT